MRFTIAFAVFLSLVANIFSQNNNEEIKVKFGGYVNWTAIYDSRQVVAAREGHFLLYPKDEQISITGKDLNNINNFQMAVIQTRASSKITGLKFLGASTTGMIEAEFMGNSDADVNGFRIRHAFIDLNWGDYSLLMGQYWTPLFITDMYPDQIGSNAGVPFQPFGRNPQIRLTYKTGSLKTFFALVSQRDYTSTGPNGSSSQYQRNAVLPDFHYNVQFTGDSYLFGLGGEYKKLMPGTDAKSNYSSDQKLDSYAGIAFLKLMFAPVTFKVEGIYGSNLTDYAMLGGYAVHSTDTLSNTISYSAIKTFSVWSELCYGKSVEVGIFGGFTKNLGSDETVNGAYYSRGSNINYVTRIAPRIQYKEGNTKTSFEIEYTTANYGTPDNYGKVSGDRNISNLRVYTSVYYFF